MSKELTLNAKLSCKNGIYQENFIAGNLQLDQLNQGAAGGIAATTTSASNLDYGSVSTANAGYLCLQNLDGTNSCDFGTATDLVGRLLPDEVAMFRIIPGKQIQLKAVTGTPNIKYWILRR